MSLTVPLCGLSKYSSDSRGGFAYREDFLGGHGEVEGVFGDRNAEGGAVAREVLGYLLSVIESNTRVGEVSFGFRLQSLFPVGFEANRKEDTRGFWDGFGGCGKLLKSG